MRTLPALRRCGARACASLLCLIAAALVAGRPACAEEDGAFGEIETKYIFGFTEGSGIGLEGEKEVSAETIAALGKRAGRFFGAETKLEFEQTPSQFVELEFGALLSSHAIANVPGLDDRHAVGFGGLFGELRYLLVERSASSPISVTFSAEPVWRRIDETSGEHVTNFEFETRLAADYELVENRVFLAFNALYEPETTRTPEGSWEKEATLGVSTAIAFRLAPSVLMGGELWYLRHYDTIGLGAFTGDAVYFGPTLYLQLSRKAFLSAAWNVQVAGREVGQPGSLDLADFSRHRAKLKLAVEF
jgi:hypothetical protein